MRASSTLPKRTAAFLLLLVLIIPVLAACGGTAPATQNPTTAPAAAEATTAPAEPTAAAPTEAATVAADATASPAASTNATAAATPAASTGAAGDTGKFLVYGNSGEPDSIDALDVTNGVALIVADQIEERLADFKPGTLELTPRLADKWTPNADSTEWTFNLHPGIKFHDGTDFNADAVVFNFQRLSDPKFEFGYRDKGKTYSIFPDIFGGFVGDENSIWDSISAKDANTVVIKLKRPTPLLPNFLAAGYFGLSSPDAVKKGADKYGTTGVGAVGTGPFKFSEWRAGENLTLVRNDDYWGDKAKMPGVVVRFIADAPQRLAELQAGSVDLTTNLAPDARETIQNDAKLALTPLDPFNIAYLALNMHNKPFDNPKVRQAISYAIDKKAILDGFYGGIGTVATDFLPDSLKWARPTTVDGYEYNPDKAKQLLKEAGYPNGISTMVLTDGKEVPLELWYMPVSRPYYPTAQPIAEAYATYLADVGIKVELKTEDWGVYLDNVDAGKKNGMFMLGWTGDYGDPNNFLGVHFGPSWEVKAGYKNQKVWDLLKQAGSAKTQDEATKLFQDAGTIINQDLPLIPIVHAPPVIAQKKALTGWTLNPTGGESWASIFIEK